jgi:NAD(P)H dehydrogenase (quinone)
MTERPVLVVGANGNTGSAAIDNLVQRDVKVRALVQTDDERASRLRSRGVEVAIGDVRNLDDVRAALAGIGAAYFIYAIQPGLIEATAYFAQAAREAGVSAIINMSQISARADAKSHAALNHWVAERVLDWSGIPITHLRPTFFANWLIYPHFAQYVRRDQVIAFPFARAQHAPIAAEDQG